MKGYIEKAVGRILEDEEEINSAEKFLKMYRKLEAEGEIKDYEWVRDAILYFYYPSIGNREFLELYRRREVDDKREEEDLYLAASEYLYNGVNEFNEAIEYEDYDMLSSFMSRLNELFNEIEKKYMQMKLDRIIDMGAY